MKKLLLFVFLSFALFSSATDITLILDSSVNSNVAGVDIRNLNYFATGAELQTTKVGGIITAGTLYFDALTNCGVACLGTIKNTPVGYGWASFKEYEGFIPAGNWTFKFNTQLSTAQTAKLGYIGVNVFKVCQGVFTQLFYVQGTTNVLINDVSDYYTTIRTTQPDYVLNNGCYLGFEYWLNTTTGFSVATHRIELHILGTDVVNKSIILPEPQKLIQRDIILDKIDATTMYMLKKQVHKKPVFCIPIVEWCFYGWW